MQVRGCKQAGEEKPFEWALLKYDLVKFLLVEQRGEMPPWHYATSELVQCDHGTPAQAERRACLGLALLRGEDGKGVLSTL